MNTDPTRESSEPLYTQHFIPDPSRPDRAVIIGPSSPAWFPPRRANAENFNPFHDELGRFTTGDGAAGQKEHLGYTGDPTKQNNKGAAQKQAAQKPVGSIMGYAFDSRDFAMCLVASIQTMIATNKQTRNVPGEESIKEQIRAAAKGIFTNPQEKVDWSNGGVKAFTDHQAAIVQKVLKDNEVQATVQLSHSTAKALADAIVESKQPVMISVHREGTIAAEEHAATVQWLPDAAGANQGRFLINKALDQKIG